MSARNQEYLVDSEEEARDVIKWLGEGSELIKEKN